MSGLSAPELTFPPEVAACVREAYAEASAILEFGSGGSTVLAAERGVPCMSVENDRTWADGVLAWLDHAYPGHNVRMHKVFIGPTRKWGRPSQSQAPLWRWRYKAYPTSVWRRRDLTLPDTVLIDGRFRPACFLTTLSHLSAPARILFDDYVGRPHYDVIERYAAPVRLVGRMAVFDVGPGLVTAADLAEHRRLFSDPE